MLQCSILRIPGPMSIRIAVPFNQISLIRVNPKEMMYLQWK